MEERKSFREPAGTPELAQQCAQLEGKRECDAVAARVTLMRECQGMEERKAPPVDSESMKKVNQGREAESYNGAPIGSGVDVKALHDRTKSQFTGSSGGNKRNDVKSKVCLSSKLIKKRASTLVKDKMKNGDEVDFWQSVVGNSKGASLNDGRSYHSGGAENRFYPNGIMKLNMYTPMHRKQAGLSQYYAFMEECIAIFGGQQQEAYSAEDLEERFEYTQRAYYILEEHSLYQKRKRTEPYIMMHQNIYLH